MDVVSADDSQAYSAYANRMAGAPVGAQQPAYPMYGVPTLGQAAGQAAGMLRNPFVTFLLGAAVVGSVWLYVDVIKPMREQRKGR